MDFLKAEIAAKKRKATAEPEAAAAKEKSDDGAGKSKYIRRGDQPRRDDAGESQGRKDASGSVDRAGSVKNDGSGRQARLSPSTTSTPPPQSTSQRGDQTQGKQEHQASAPQGFNISNEETIRRLRAKGEPIRLFDESDQNRRLRLRALELIEERGEKMGQNDFMRAMRGAERDMLSRELEAKSVKKTKAGDEEAQRESDGKTDGQTDDGAGSSSHSAAREGVGMNSLLDLTLIKRDINKVYPIIYYTLKGLLSDWEQSLAERPIEVRQSHQGKLVAATQVQTADYLKPLFKQLRHRSVKPDVLARLAEIVHYVQKREYRHANDSYLQLSIGNAPWPIGVTMVGIHERSGREKIFSSNVAHVLNDEVSRKYIQSLKRLMTFAQTKYPPENVSMLMG